MSSPSFEVMTGAEIARQINAKKILSDRGTRGRYRTH